MAAYDNINKVLELMKKKKEPVKSYRKIDKKSKKKLDVEQFLPKERSKTVSDEIINSRRIKKELDAEYARVQGKSNSLDSKAREALKKLVTKSTGDIIEEQRKLDILNSKKVKSDTQQLLEYFENKSTPEELLNRVPEYVDADAAVKKEIRDLIKLGGYRDLAKQKSIIKKFIGGTPLQRQELIADIEATPKAQAMKREMDDIKAVIKAEKALMDAEKKAEKQKLATAKLLAEQKNIDAKLLAAQKISDAKADKAAKKLLAKSTRGIALSPAEQQILLDKQTRDAETARLAQVAQIEADRLAQEASDKLAAKKTKAAELSLLLATGKTIIEAREALAKQREIDRLQQIEDDRIAEEARLVREETARLAAVKLDKKLKLERTKTAILTLARERKAETERLEAEKEENKRIDDIVKSMRLPGYKDSTKETFKNNTQLRTLAAARMKAEDLAAGIPPAAVAPVAAVAAAAGTPVAAKRGRGRPPKAKAAAPAAAAPSSAPPSAPSSPPPVPTGKGFELNNYMGKGFQLNKSSLPYGARMMIERYDNEKKLRKN